MPVYLRHEPRPNASHPDLCPKCSVILLPLVAHGTNHDFTTDLGLCPASGCIVDCREAVEGNPDIGSEYWRGLEAK